MKENNRTLYQKIRNAIKTCAEHLFIIDFILILLFIIVEKTLNLFDISFRHWFQMLYGLVLSILFFIGLVKLYLNNKSAKKIMNFTLVLVMILAIILGIIGAVFYRHALLFGFLIGMGIQAFTGIDIREHVVEINSEKKVAYVQYLWTDTTVEYHDYYNLFFCSHSYSYDSYSGVYDIYDEEHIENKDNLDNSNNIISNTNQSSQPSREKNTFGEITKDDEVLYKQKFNNVTIAAVCKGDAMGNHIVQILRSEDDEKTWISMIDNSEGLIQLHYGTEFVFFNENFGYYLDKGRQGTAGLNSDFSYTDDGGKNFYNVKLLLSETEIGDKEYTIDELPIYENNEYNLKITVYQGKEEIEYTLYSYDGKQFYLK